MTSHDPRGPFAHLVEQLQAGQISRRGFLTAGAALGVSTGMLGTVIRHAQSVGAAPHRTPPLSPPAHRS